MNAYDLPSSISIGGREFPIRSGWRHILRILVACEDPEVSKRAKTIIILKIFYPDWKSIPPNLVQEACEKACKFIDCGQKKNGKSKPRMIDWEQDAPLIIPAVNQVAKQEVRLDPDIHWWTFFGWFMNIGDSLFSSVLHIRQKQAKGEKLDKFEKKFYMENKSLCDLEKRYTEEELNAIEDVKNWFMGGG